MNTLESFNIPRNLRLAPYEERRSVITGKVGKYWRQHFYRPTDDHSANVRTGRRMYGATAATLALVALTSCSTEAAPETNTACVRLTDNTVTVEVQNGDTENGILIKNINGVTYGTCLDTAKDLAVQMNGVNVGTPRAGNVFILPAELAHP